MRRDVALIFGANGQDGHYLSECLRGQGIAAVGISRSGPFVHADLANFQQVEQLVREHRPGYLFHLGASSTTRHEAIFDNHGAIVTGTLNVLEAVKRHCPDCRVFITGSGVQFRNEGKPISENDPFEPSSAYAVARIQSVHTARYFRSLGIAAYVGYLFHHESPLRKAAHLSKMIATAARKGETITLGDISVRKEWTFAGDIARAIAVLVRQDQIWEAALGSGVAHSIEEWLAACYSAVGRNWKDYVKRREGYVPDYRLLVSNPATIRSLGWSPTVDLQHLAQMMVDSKRTEGNAPA